jgi:hypothetical protein
MLKLEVSFSDVQCRTWGAICPQVDGDATARVHG